MENNKQIEELLAKTALNDRAAFEKLYALTSPKLYGIALLMLKKKDLAEEVLQEAFVKIWYNANQYHHDRGAPLAWMISIVRYRAIDFIRSQKHFVDVNELDSSTILDKNDNSNAKLTEDIDECLDELQEQQKKSVLLAFYEGYTHQELAKKLSVPLGTMKSWIRRSLDKLKGCLDELR